MKTTQASVSVLLIVLFASGLVAYAQGLEEDSTPPRTSAPAASEPDAVPAEAPPDWLHGERLTGDWFGIRPALEERGVTVDLGLTTIFQQNVKGGRQTNNAHRISGSYDLELTFDFGALGLWKGGTLYSLAEGSWDEGISDAGYVGDLFGVNGDAGDDRTIDVTELWYEQSFFDDGLRIRFGKINLGVDFDTNAYANDETAQFLNNALVNAGNIPFPDNGQGIQFVATPCEWFWFGAGIADAEADARETGFRTAYHGPDYFFSVFEFGLSPTLETRWGRLPGQYRFGLSYDPQPKERFFDDLDGRRLSAPLKRDDVGFYTSFDQVIFREAPDVEGDEQGLGLFVRYAYAHGDVNEIDNFWSVGGQYRGLIPTRDDDVLGCGVAQGILSRQLRYAGADPHRETALELYYNTALLPWLSVSPSFQWILRPGGEDGRDAFVAGIRLQMSF